MLCQVQSSKKMQDGDKVPMLQYWPSQQGHQEMQEGRQTHSWKESVSNISIKCLFIKKNPWPWLLRIKPPGRDWEFTSDRRVWIPVHRYMPGRRQSHHHPAPNTTSGLYPHPCHPIITSSSRHTKWKWNHCQCNIWLNTSYPYWRVQTKHKENIY